MREALGVLHEAAREDVPAQLSVGEDSDSRPRLKRDRLVDGAILDRLEVGAGELPASRRRRASSKAGGRSNEPTFSARTAFTVPARSLPSRLGHGGLAAARRPELLTRPRKRIMIHRTTRRTPWRRPRARTDTEVEMATKCLRRVFLVAAVVIAACTVAATQATAQKGPTAHFPGEGQAPPSDAEGAGLRQDSQKPAKRYRIAYLTEVHQQPVLRDEAERAQGRSQEVRVRVQDFRRQLQSGHAAQARAGRGGAGI